MITLTSVSHTPIYQQIIEQVLAQIACGVLAPDTQLPGVRNLAKDLGINPNTVVKAYNELEHAGFIYSKPGVGSFVKARHDENAALIQLKMEDIFNSIALIRKLGVSKETLSALLDDVYTKENPL